MPQHSHNRITLVEVLFLAFVFAIVGAFFMTHFKPGPYQNLQSSETLIIPPRPTFVEPLETDIPQAGLAQEHSLPDDMSIDGTPSFPSALVRENRQ